MKKRRKARRRHPGDGKPYAGRTGQGCGGSSVLDRSCVACGARRGSCGAGAWRHRGSWAEIYAWLTRGTGLRKSAGLPGTAHRAGALARGTPLSDFARGWRRRPSPGPPRAAQTRPPPPGRLAHRACAWPTAYPPRHRRALPAPSSHGMLGAEAVSVRRAWRELEFGREPEVPGPGGLRSLKGRVQKAVMLPGQGAPPAAAQGAPGRIPSPQSVAFPRLHDLLHRDEWLPPVLLFQGAQFCRGQ